MKYLILAALFLAGCTQPIIRDNDKEEQQRQEQRKQNRPHAGNLF